MKEHEFKLILDGVKNPELEETKQAFELGITGSEYFVARTGHAYLRVRVEADTLRDAILQTILLVNPGYGYVVAVDDFDTVSMSRAAERIGVSKQYMGVVKKVKKGGSIGPSPIQNIDNQNPLYSMHDVVEWSNSWPNRAQTENMDLEDLEVVRDINQALRMINIGNKKRVMKILKKLADTEV